MIYRTWFPTAVSCDVMHDCVYTITDLFLGGTQAKAATYIWCSCYTESKMH